MNPHSLSLSDCQQFSVPRVIVERDAARTKHLHQFEQFIKTKPNTTTTTIYKKCVWIFFVHEPTTTTYLVCSNHHPYAF